MLQAVDSLDTGDRDIAPAPPFVTEADWIPNFWNYLLNLDRYDLVAELVQNDLDQEATRTVISFERDRLVCSGNGNPVGQNGWLRLRKIQGAGDTVPAKRGKIGVKNHGLKTAFAIGNELRLMSDGLAITQTLFAKGPNEPPYPGASDFPIRDPEAPSEGCRISVPYRTTAVRPPHGEAIELAPISSTDIDEIFLAACKNAPEQFAGIVSPELVPRYQIVLRHWRLGEASFDFSCTRPRKIAKRMQVFRRRCDVDGDDELLPPPLREQAVRRLFPLKGHLRKRVADFYNRGKYYIAEVSWPIDVRGKPKTGTGRFRYPIGYPQDSHEARTGHAANFNAPFVSDSKRHGPARNETTFTELRKACESLLVDALAVHCVPKYGPRGLNPLVPPTESDSHKRTVRPLLEALANRGRLPVMKWRAAAELVLRGRKRAAKQGLYCAALRNGPARDRRYRFVIPMANWGSDTIQPALSLLCPRAELQLDPRTNPVLIRLLVEDKTFHVSDSYLTFDEHDAFSRVTDAGNSYFSGFTDLEREFAQPLIARAYLDLINLALEECELDQKTEQALFNVLLLPNTRGKAIALADLYSSTRLPSDIPALRLPHLLHRDLVNHPLFRRNKWRLTGFTMARFLEGGTLQAADRETRIQFWRWLRQNQQAVPRRDRPKLADLAIWPDHVGRPRRLGELCDPRSRLAVEALADSITRPHEQVRRSRLVSFSTRARLSIRRIPSREEIDHWFGKRMPLFVLEEKPDSATATRLTRFEAELVILLKNAGIKRLLKSSGAGIPALALDGSLRPRTDLVVPSPANDRLKLPGRFMLSDKRSTAALGVLWPALRAPTATMLLAAFSEDGGNYQALQARLRYFLGVTRPDDDKRRRLAQIPVIPVNERPHSPSLLAFARPARDYWGDWKIRIPTRGLSQDSQARYRAIGVTSSVPNRSSSRAFFRWLSSRKPDVLKRHIPCVLRHILHPDGPANWADSFTDIPFIPVHHRDSLQLVSLQTAKRTPVLLSDAGERIANAVLQRDDRVRLVVDHVKQVTEPISDRLRDLGLRSLREALGEPARVIGTGDRGCAPDEYTQRIHGLRANRFRRTFLKRLNDLDVELGLVRRDWHDRLGRIRDIRYAEKVTARHRFRRRMYSMDVDAGLDSKTGIYWIRQKRVAGPSSIYESIARQLIFKPEARRIDLLALERTIALEVTDPSFVSATARDANPLANQGADAEPSDDDVDPDPRPDPGEARGGHSPFDPDPARNQPKPGPIPTTTTVRSGGASGRTSSRRTDNTGIDPSKTPALEKEHIQILKLSHYASHCQKCLCERPPGELAPPGSYIQWEEVRRRVMEAHHVDPKAAGGARHAGNLILLCKYHHDNLGRRLTRTAITTALKAGAKRKHLRFEPKSAISGREIALTLPDTGEVVRLFFTDYHAKFWLELHHKPE